MIISYSGQKKIVSWRQFDSKVRSNGSKLLNKLDKFPEAILVSGCQRSGTTALARLITTSEGIVKFWFGKDDELDAALILSGYVLHDPIGRYCFQTTYLNNSYEEYFEHENYKLIWLLRRPHSVIYSMLYNWKISALNRLFRHCGSVLLEERDRWRYDRLGVLGISRIKRACLSYNAKVSQLFELRQRLFCDQLLVVDYDDVVKHKMHLLPAIYKFADIPYRDDYLSKMHPKSLDKANQFSAQDAAFIDSICMPTYKKAYDLRSDFT